MSTRHRGTPRGVAPTRNRQAHAANAGRPRDGASYLRLTALRMAAGETAILTGKELARVAGVRQYSAYETLRDLHAEGLLVEVRVRGGVIQPCRFYPTAAGQAWLARAENARGVEKRAATNYPSNEEKDQCRANR